MSAEDAAGFGLSLDELYPPAEVWHENVPTVNVYLAVLSQWRLAPTGQRLGIDYPSLESTLRMLRYPRSAWPGVFDGIRLMEDAALQVMNRGK